MKNNESGIFIVSSHINESTEKRIVSNQTNESTGIIESRVWNESGVTIVTNQHNES
jgi:hypothetical protein